MSYHNAAAFARNFAKLGAQSSFSIKKMKLLSPIKLRAVVEGGFAYEEFDAKGQVSTWSIKRLLKFIRTASFMSKAPEFSFLDMDRLLQDYFTFMASVSLHYDREVYSVELPKSPVTVDLELATFGRTSFTMKNAMYFQGVDRPLVTQVMQGVFVNAKTRRPHSPPEWWREKFSPCINPDFAPLRFDRVQLPKETQVKKVDMIVQAGDVDPYSHLCSSNFIKICMNAYVLWHIKNTTQELGSDVLKYLREVKGFTQSFFGEAAIGDILTVHFWEHPEKDNVVSFFVSKSSKPSLAIFDTVVEFHPNDS